MVVSLVRNPRDEAAAVGEARYVPSQLTGKQLLIGWTLIMLFQALSRTRPTALTGDNNAVLHQYSLAVLMTFLPSVLVLLSLLLRLRFMLFVALVRDMLGARRTKDSMRLASRDDRLGTLALELMGAPAARRELTDSRAFAAEHRGLWEGASLLDDSDTELTSGELTLTSPMEMAVAGSVAADAAEESLFLASSPAVDPSAVSVPQLDPEPDPPSAAEDSTTIGSC